SVAHRGRPADGAAGALRRNPDRRMRALDGSRPRIDVVELVVLARVGERPGLGPGAYDQGMRFREALLRQHRIDAHGRIFGAGPADEARGEAAVREVVEDFR